MKYPGLLRSAEKCSGMILVAAMASSVPAKNSGDLPAYHVDLSQTSVSGLSSGGFMATQFHVAFSSTLVGVGVIAAGPYYCAGSAPATPFLENAMTLCMNPVAGAGPDAATLLQKAKVFATLGDIDSLDHLKKAKVYLFSGKADTTVSTKVVNQTAAFYQLAGVAAGNIKYINTLNAGHSIITNNAKDGACLITAAPYINDCHFMQSQDILHHIYGDLQPPSTQLSGTMLTFRQRQFMPTFIQAYFSSMSDEGHAYVPKSCETETCKVHIAFHGCEQGEKKIGNLFYTTTGYNELADSNHIIVLYPQVDSRAGFFPPYNPKGCWDFWGYSSLNMFAPNFYTRQATQMATVKAMLDQLAKPRH